jgi:hypothetical protein
MRKVGRNEKTVGRNSEKVGRNDEKVGRKDEKKFYNNNIKDDNSDGSKLSETL